MPELELRSDYKAHDVFLDHTLLLYGNVVDLPQLDTFFQGPNGLACEVLRMTAMTMTVIAVKC